MRRLITVPGLLLAMVLFGGQALAAPEWCDSGSPPPNDWRLRPTGGQSLLSPTWWLRSTTSGTLDLRAGINTLEGGVATGMLTALVHARPYSELPHRDSESPRADSEHSHADD